MQFSKLKKVSSAFKDNRPGTKRGKFDKDGQKDLKFKKKELEGEEKTGYFKKILSTLGR